jgi:valyl-tRNA synthetase
MKRFHARVEVVKALKEMGLFVETKDNPMQIPICRYVKRNGPICGVRTKYSHSKSGDVIEPVLKPQWWVNCQPLAEEAIKVRQGCLLYHRVPIHVV